MTIRTRALVSFAAVLGGVGAVGLFLGAWARPRRVRRVRRVRRERNPAPLESYADLAGDDLFGRWVTLSNRRRVMVSGEGRVLKGLPDTYRDVHVKDVSKLSRGLRKLKRAEKDCDRPRRAGGARFRDRQAFVQALANENPELADFLQLNWGRDSQAYVEGRKPPLDPHDGRFDAINERLNLRGKRKVSSWAEAFEAVAPPSRRWADVSDRLDMLEEATGITIQPPEATVRAQTVGDDAADCAQRADRQIVDLVAQAKRGRLAKRKRRALDEAPF